MSKEYVEFQFEAGDIKGKIEGYSNMPFWNHDLKLEAILALLNTVDYKDFFEGQNLKQLDNYTKKIIEAVEYSLGFDGLYQLAYGNTKN